MISKCYQCITTLMCILLIYITMCESLLLIYIIKRKNLKVCSLWYYITVDDYTGRLKRHTVQDDW